MLALTCLLMFLPWSSAIMVKFGTRDGPITARPSTEPPPLVPDRPLPKLAPVWEERDNDTPDPNANWRPQMFFPQPMYTKINITPQPQYNNAQQFVNAYLPTHKPIPAQPVKNYFTPAQILSSQRIPGFGIRYFVPTYKRQEEKEKAKDLNSENNVDNEVNNDVGNNDDEQWKQEKELAKRKTRHSQEGTFFAPATYVYRFPVYRQY